MNQVTASGAVKCPELKYFQKQHNLGIEFTIMVLVLFYVLKIVNQNNFRTFLIINHLRVQKSHPADQSKL